MNTNGFALCVIAVAAFSAALPVAAFAACDARSGQKTAALIELYTSEGCSSCPPADQQLSRLRQALDPAAEAVPLALHVDYWDYIGWKDPYAQAAFGERQNWLVQANQHKTIYTPQFFVGGTEVRSWRGGLREQVRQVECPARRGCHSPAREHRSEWRAGARCRSDSGRRRGAGRAVSGARRERTRVERDPRRKPRSDLGARPCCARMDRPGPPQRRSGPGETPDRTAGGLEPRTLGSGHICGGRAHRWCAAGIGCAAVRGLLISDWVFP